MKPCLGLASLIFGLLAPSPAWSRRLPSTCPSLVLHVHVHAAGSGRAFDRYADVSLSAGRRGQGEPIGTSCRFDSARRFGHCGQLAEQTLAARDRPAGIRALEPSSPSPCMRSGRSMRRVQSSLPASECQCTAAFGRRHMQ